MSLTFLTHAQQMTFVNHATHVVVSAWNLMPGNSYDVFFTIQNDSNTEVLAGSYTVQVTHSAFGIGSTSGTSFLHQPVTVNIPPAGPGGNGLATLEFQFDAAESGHCCLLAQINPTTGPVLQQNLDVYNSAVPVGTATKLPFYVYWDSSSIVKLTVTEKSITNAGAIVNFPGAAGDTTWNPTLQVPTPPTQTLVTPTFARLERAGAPNPTLCYIKITPTPLASGISGHLFHIVGTNDAGTYIGEADIRVEHPVTGTYFPPSPYISGGYQSADIKLYNADGTEVPLGGLPSSTQWDTLLTPNTDYRFSAVIHNASITDAVNTIVRFWSFTGGVGSAGTLLDIQTVTIPHGGSFEVFSSHPFHSAASGHHRCAAVSIYNPLSGMCAADATTCYMVPSPGNTGDPRCSAWRNTDSMFVIPNDNWHFNLELTQMEFDPNPIDIMVNGVHVPVEWKKNPEVLKTDAILNAAGAKKKLPLFMMPNLKETMHIVDLKPVIKSKGLMKVDKEIERNRFRIQPSKEKSTPFEVSGIVPSDAKDGDVILVKVTATYPKTNLSDARSIEFLEVLHVTTKKRENKE